MRISDWSSDVCSSDLQLSTEHQPVPGAGGRTAALRRCRALGADAGRGRPRRGEAECALRPVAGLQHAGRNPAGGHRGGQRQQLRSEEHTSELQSLMRISYAVFCLKKKNAQTITQTNTYNHINTIK